MSKGRGDRLASGGISAQFIPDNTNVTQESWDQSFKNAKTRNARAKAEKNTFGCNDCNGSWKSATEFHAHIPTCPMDSGLTLCAKCRGAVI